MENRGELTTKQIVGLIILIISFAVILIFIFALDLSGTTRKEVCHNSVILKGKSEGLVGELDCRTNYVCISGGGKCEGIPVTETRKVDADNKTQIMQAIAEEMRDCWWMFGEGEINYVGSVLGSHCAICSTIKFDDKVRDKTSVDPISTREFYQFLETPMKKKTISYLTYLYEVRNLEKFLDKFEEAKEKYNANPPIETREKYLVITGLDENFEAWGLREEDQFLHPRFIKASELDEIDFCLDFDITKA